MLPFWMKASWFRKYGYRQTDRYGNQVLLWKPFASDALPPRWIRPKKKPQTAPNKVAVTAFLSGWCPAQNMVFERALRASSELGGKVVFQWIDTLNGNTFLDYGISDALFIDGKEVRTGPPPSYEKIKRAIGKRVRKL